MKGKNTTLGMIKPESFFLQKKLKKYDFKIVTQIVATEIEKNNSFYA